MRGIKSSQKGMTLLEVMLALAISGMIIILSYKQVLIYQFNSNVAYIQHDMEELFNAALLYYRANCNSAVMSSGSSPATVSINTLISSQYLATNWQSSPLSNNLVDTSGGTNGYAVQLNLIPTTTPMNAVCSGTDCNKTYPTLSPLSTTSSPVLVWEIQVSVKIKNMSQTLAQDAANALGASCLTNSSASAIYSCRQLASTAPPYGWIAMTRLPSFANSHDVSPYWASMPLLKQFNLLYTHDQMYELGSQSFIDSGNGTGNYTCGS